MGQRWVLHLDMDAFFASVEQLTRPTLRGKPVIVAGVGGRGVVAGASYEARALGARSAQPTFQAERLVGPRCNTIIPRHRVYAAASRRVFALVAKRCGTIEQISIDEAFVEPAVLAGAEVATAAQFAAELREAVFAETGLSCSIGGGSGKLVAKIASAAAKPKGQLLIPVAEQQAQLWPLPVRKLWGIGPVAEGKLAQYGVKTIGEFAQLDLPEVQQLLGAVGADLWLLARGHDERPVQPRGEAKSISNEYTYPEDLTSAAQMDAAIKRAFTSAYRRLMKDGRGAKTVTVKLKRADFQTETRSFSLGYATDDEDILWATVQKVVRYPQETGPIRLVGVGFSGLEQDRQLVLFPELDKQAQVQVTEVTEPAASQEVVPAAAAVPQWHRTQDVQHPDYGHGWITGLGQGIMTVRFETRATGVGKSRSFALADPAISPAEPLASLAWDEWLEQSGWMDPAGDGNG